MENIRNIRRKLMNLKTVSTPRFQMIFNTKHLKSLTCNSWIIRRGKIKNSWSIFAYCIIIKRDSKRNYGIKSNVYIYMRWNDWSLYESVWSTFDSISVVIYIHILCGLLRNICISQMIHRQIFTASDSCICWAQANLYVMFLLFLSFIHSCARLNRQAMQIE